MASVGDRRGEGAANQGGGREKRSWTLEVRRCDKQVDEKTRQAMVGGGRSRGRGRENEIWLHLVFLRFSCI